MVNQYHSHFRLPFSSPYGTILQYLQYSVLEYSSRLRLLCFSEFSLLILQLPFEIGPCRTASDMYYDYCKVGKLWLFPRMNLTKFLSHSAMDRSLKDTLTQERVAVRGVWDRCLPTAFGNHCYDCRSGNDNLALIATLGVVHTSTRSSSVAL